MKTFISNIIPRLVRYSEIKNFESIFVNQPWNLYTDSEDKIVYIFRNINKELIISVKGIVSKGNWDLIDQNNMILDTNDNSYLFKIRLFENGIIVLNLSGTNEYAFLYNERIINLLSLSITEIEKHLEKKLSNRISTGLESGKKTTKESIKEAFCLGCRTIDKTDKLLYISESDSYYHPECLKKINTE
jgi:hypothetical protein